jgi:hypothetical protein
MANDIIVDTGLVEILSRALGLVANGPLHIAVGSGNTPPAGSETALDSEIARAAVIVQSVTGNQANLRAFFNTAQANGSIGESGLVTEASGGVLVERGVENPALTKASSQELIVEKVITLERA